MEMCIVVTSPFRKAWGVSGRAEDILDHVALILTYRSDRFLLELTIRSALGVAPVDGRVPLIALPRFRTELVTLLRLVQANAIEFIGVIPWREEGYEERLSLFYNSSIRTHLLILNPFLVHLELFRRLVPEIPERFVLIHMLVVMHGLCAWEPEIDQLAALFCIIILTRIDAVRIFGKFNIFYVRHRLVL